MSIRVAASGVIAGDFKGSGAEGTGVGGGGGRGLLISGQLLVQIVMWGASRGREQQRVREQLDEARYGPPLLIPVDQTDPNPRNPGVASRL